MMHDQRKILIIGNFLSKIGGNRGVCEDLADKLSDHKWYVITTSNKRNRFLRMADMP